MTILTHDNRAATVLPASGRWTASVAAALTFWFVVSIEAYAQQTLPGAGATEKNERRRELEILRKDLDHTRDAETRLKSEIESIKNDRKKLSQELLNTATRMQTIEQKLSAAEQRLAPLATRETEIQHSLESRRAVLAEVLGALTRIGRQPVPVILVRPDDALESVRSAIMLGALVPELRNEAERLATDLSELSRIRRDISVEREALSANRTALEQDRRRVTALIDQRQRLQSESEKALADERIRSATLAKQVETVSDLVTRMEREIASAARAAEAARRQEEVKTSLSAFVDPGRIAPAAPFALAKGHLSLPLSGKRTQEYGTPDGLGGAAKGLSIEARPAAQVVAPCDGWVVYAGLFRSYGRLLIINAGGGYHILLAGMEQITVDIGQFVLTGEPVAVMGNEPQAASASQPTLYIEFRKDGNSIDPEPWWAGSENEKARG